MRVLLIDKINENTCDIMSLIDDSSNQYSLTDQQIIEIENTLLIHTFDELVNKYDPALFMTIDFEQGEVQSSRCANGLPGEFKIDLCQKHSIFYQIINLMNDIHEGKYAMLTVNDLEDGFWVCPSLNEQDFSLKREHIFQLLAQNQQKQAEIELVKILNSYDKELFLLHRLILYSTEMNETKNQGKHVRRFLFDDSITQLKTIAVSDKFLQKKYHNEFVEIQYKKLLTKLIYKDSLHTYRNAQLLEWNMQMGCIRLTETELHKIDSIQNKLQKIHQKVMKNYWISAQPVLQTLLNCYCLIQKKEQDISLILSNCTIHELAHSKRLDSFRTFLNTTNNKLYRDKRIESAILPNIRTEDEKIIPKRIRFQAEEKVRMEYILNEKEDAESISSILEEYDIKTRYIMHTEGRRLSEDLIGEFSIEGNWLNEEQKNIYKCLNELMLQL